MFIKQSLSKHEARSNKSKQDCNPLRCFGIDYNLTYLLLNSYIHHQVFFFITRIPNSNGPSNNHDHSNQMKPHELLAINKVIKNCSNEWLHRPNSSNDSDIDISHMRKIHCQENGRVYSDKHAALN